jgi:hypothetical protein
VAYPQLDSNAVSRFVRIISHIIILAVTAIRSAALRIRNTGPPLRRDRGSHRVRGLVLIAEATGT